MKTPEPGLNGLGVLAGVAVAVAAAASLLLSGCGGGGGSGGGGGGGGTGGTATLLSITAQGAGAGLWQWVAGNPSTPPVCPASVYVNGEIVFTFDGAVSPSTVPNFGFASGTINITATVSGFVAAGTFIVQDDPGFPAGNQRRVVFKPNLPTSATAACTAGLEAGQNYQIFVPGGGGANVVNVAGASLTNSATACFSTCGCPNPATCPTTYVDSIPGAPFVINTIPATANPVPAPISACSVGNNTVMIRVSEPLDPAGIDLSSVRLVNVATGAQVPGSIVFHQAGTIAGIFTVSQIDYVAWAPLVHGQTYEVILGPSVKDLGGNPVQPVAGNPNAQLFFQTAPVASVSQPLDEPFDTTANLGDLTGPMRWAGDGVLQAEQPTSLVGNGADGALNAPAGVTTILDTNEIVGGQSRQGIWNFTDVTIPATATVRVVGPYLAHFRCTRQRQPPGNADGERRDGPVQLPERVRQGPGAGHPEQQRRTELRGRRRRRQRRGRRGRDRVGDHSAARQPADLPVHAPGPARRERLRSYPERAAQHRHACQPALRGGGGRRQRLLPRGRRRLLRGRPRRSRRRRRNGWTDRRGGPASRLDRRLHSDCQRRSADRAAEPRPAGDGSADLGAERRLGRRRRRRSPRPFWHAPQQR